MLHVAVADIHQNNGTSMIGCHFQLLKVTLAIYKILLFKTFYLTQTTRYTAKMITMLIQQTVLKMCAWY